MVKRNANREGTRPRKRADGRWEARYWTPEGKRRSVYGKTRKEAAEKLQRAIAGLEDPSEGSAATITLEEFLKQYEDAARDTMKRRSFETYLDIARVHLLPAFGSLKLKNLTREKVQQLYTQKRKDGLSPARVRRIHGVLSAALNYAVKWRLVEHNICQDVTPPRVPAPKIRPLSVEEAKRFLAAAQGDTLEALYVLGVTSGMRIGELGGLFWSDVDLDNRVLHVQRSLITGQGGQTFESPKTSGSRRNITLTKKATDSLLCHQELQREQGFPVEGDELVFTNTKGDPINPSHFYRRSFKPLLKRAGLSSDITFHAATRHTCCCILLQKGVNPKAVSMQLGHSSVAFTLQRYAHFLPGFGDNGAMDDALS